jgi:hypothetical protein
MEAGDSKESDKLEEGTGMGEGEGQTDVSDQIENETQLSGVKEDEKPPEQDQQGKKDDSKKEEDKDKGVEMSEDFEGKLGTYPHSFCFFFSLHVSPSIHEYFLTFRCVV